MTVIFLPIGFILVFIIAGAGLAYTIMSNIQSILLGGLLGAVLAAVFLGIHFLIGFYRQKTGNILFTICRLLLWVFLLVGWLFCMEVTHLDESRYFFDWLGTAAADSIASQATALVAISVIIMLGSLVLLTIAAFLPFQPLRSLFCLLQIALFVGVGWFSISVCTTSYSDYQVKCFSVEEAPEEYTVTDNAAIYYPSMRRENRFPMALPWKWSSDSFSAGETVYLLSDVEDYALVGNTETAGYIEKSLLQKVDQPVYQYSLRIREDVEQVPFYEAVEEVLLTLNNGNQITETHLGEKVLRQLSAGEPVVRVDTWNGYLLVTDQDGAQGFVETRYVEAVRTPVATE